MTDWPDADDDDRGTSAFDPVSHKLRVLDAQCATCIGKPGNVMMLRPGRLAGLMAESVREGCQGMVCHSTLPGIAPDGYLPALCRFFYDHYGHRNNLVRIMGRIGGITEVAPPAKDWRE